MLLAKQSKTAVGRRSVSRSQHTLGVACKASALVRSSSIGLQTQRLTNSLPCSLKAPAPGQNARASQFQQRRGQVACNALPDLTGVALFFAPGMATALYALIKGKGNIKDGASRMLTEVRMDGLTNADS